MINIRSVTKRKRAIVALATILSVAGCENRTGDAVVISKEYIAAATLPAESPAGSPSPNDERNDEITVDSYVMPAEDRGTARDPRAMQHEQWLVKVRMDDNGRIINVPTDKSQFEKVNPDDRVRVRYHVGKYTGTVWGAEIVSNGGKE